MTYFDVLKCLDQIILYCHTVKFYANFFFLSKVHYSDLPQIVNGWRSYTISCTLSLGKPASGISNNCCENSVTLLDNRLFKSTSKNANNTFIPLIYVTTGLTYLSLHRCADQFSADLLFLICSK